MLEVTLMENRKEWTTTELAEHAQVTTAYLRQLLIAGKLRGYKFGRDWMIPDDEVQRWLASRKGDDK